MPQVARPTNRSVAKLVYLLKDAQRKRDGSFKIFSIREPTLKEPVAAHYGNGARLNILAHLCKMSVKKFTSDETMQRSSIRSSIYSPTCARNITRIIAREKHRDVGNFLCSSKLRKWWGRNCKLSSFGLIFAKHRSINRTTTSELS